MNHFITWNELENTLDIVKGNLTKDTKAGGYLMTLPLIELFYKDIKNLIDEWGVIHKTTFCKQDAQSGLSDNLPN